MESKQLKDIILEKLEGKGLNLEKLASLTGIPRHYLEYILKGEWGKMPASPYSRGYFRKLEGVLDCADEDLWKIYKEETEVASSGANDKLPENRFAIKRKSPKWIWIGAVLAVLAGYAAINARQLIGIPRLNIDNPLSATVISNNPFYNFSGAIDPKDKLFINGEEVYTEQDGRFQQNYDLQPGLNTFEVIAKRFLGKEVKSVKQIIYQKTQNEQ